MLSSYPGYPAGSVRPLIQPEGRGTSGVLVLSEFPSDADEKEGRPLCPHGDGGSIFERALYRAGIPRDSLTIANLVPYKPPRGWLEAAPWEGESIRVSQPLLDDLISRTQPRAILALGNLSFREMSGLAGEKLRVDMARGFLVPGVRHQIPVIGTYNPAWLRRGGKERQEEGSKGKVKAAGGGTKGMALLGVLIRDLQLAVDVARNGVPKFCYDSYRLGATLDEWREALLFLRSNPEFRVFYDFETQDSLQQESEEEAEHIIREATQVQISWRKGQALVSPWMPELLPILREIIQLPNPKVDWNGRKFDRPILREMQIRTDLGEWHDLMDTWHHAQPDLPRGLQFAGSFFCPEAGPWKHLSGSDPLYYGALDVDIPCRIMDGLQFSMSFSREAHSGVTLWGDGKYGGYTGQVVRLAPVLDRMSERGIPVDEQERLKLDEQFGQTLQDQLGELQILVPDTLKNVTPKAGYVRDPKDTTGMVRREFTAEVKCGCDWSKPPKSKAKLTEIVDCPRCQNTGKVLEIVERWANMEPFLPTSPQQVMRYIKYRRDEDLANRRALYLRRETDSPARAEELAEKRTNWQIPRDYKTDEETTGEAELRRLGAKTGDPVLPKVLDYREIKKLRGTYVQGWKPSGVQIIEGRQIGRVHPIIGFKPATGQLSSESPNSQNFPAHSDLAQAVKKMISAGPGRVLINFDYKSFHVLTLGFEACDPLYMRMARNDMHSFFALCGLLRLEPPEKIVELDDKELKAKLKWYRKQDKQYSTFGYWNFEQIRNEKAKRAILGIGFGQMERSLYMLNPESYASIHEAKQVLTMLDILFPLPAKWRDKVRLGADRDACLTSRHGYVRRFYDVYHRQPVSDNYQCRGGEKIMVSGKSGQKWVLKPGDDHEACIAFLPANDAFGTIRMAMVQMYERGLDEKFGLVNQVHDSLVFDCPQSFKEECLYTVKEIMEAPNPYLIDPHVAPGGLTCQVEAKFGPNLAEMTEYAF